MKTWVLRSIPAVLLAAYSNFAAAGAFQLWEQNASGLGTAYAGSAAIADNASTVFFNPAGMSQLSGFQFSAGLAAVGPSYTFRDEGSTTNGLPATGTNGGDAGGWKAVPNMHMAWAVTPDVSLGLGISSPFGLATEYDPEWIGRMHAVRSEIRTINVNPSISYKLNEKVALGFGLNYQTIKGELTSSLGPVGVSSRLVGDDASIGWNAGVLFNLSPAMRVGLSYRSAVKHTLVGETSDPVFGDRQVRADLKLPDTYILSVWQQVSDRWEAMGDLSYTRWESMQALDVVNRNTGVLIGREEFNYSNAWRLAWGAAYKANDRMKLKFGIAYDRTPIADGDRRARVPDNDRLWLSLGGQWNAGRQGKIDVGYAYLYVKDASINQSKTVGATTSVLNGKYDASAHILGVQYSVGF